MHTAWVKLKLTYVVFDHPGINFLTIVKPATDLAILYADRRERRKSPGESGAAIAIFADRRDRRTKSPISGMSDIGD